MSLSDRNKNFLDHLTEDSTKDCMPALQFYLMRDVKMPERAWKAAGIDFFVPKFTEEFLHDLVEKSKAGWDPKIFNNPEIETPYITLKPGERICIPSGVKVKFNVSGTALIAFNKSGIATKKGLVVGACVVDEDYLGEVHISLINTSNDEVYISENDKVVQFILLPLVKPCTFTRITQEDYENYARLSGSERGEGWAGSSNNEKESK